MKERRLFDELGQMKQSPSPMRTLRTTLAGICVAAVAASAQTTDSITNSLTLQECIQTALQHNFDVQIKRYNPEIARYTLNSSYAGYDPTFSFSGEHDYSLSPGGIDQQGRPFGRSRFPANMITLCRPAASTNRDGLSVERPVKSTDLTAICAGCSLGD